MSIDSTPAAEQAERLARSLADFERAMKGESKPLAPRGKTLRAQRRKAERASNRASAARRRTEPTDAQLAFTYLSKLRADTPGFRNVIENGELT